LSSCTYEKNKTDTGRKGRSREGREGKRVAVVGGKPQKWQREDLARKHISCATAENGEGEEKPNCRALNEFKKNTNRKFEHNRKEYKSNLKGIGGKGGVPLEIHRM